MKAPRKWRSVGTALLAAVVVPTVVVSASSSAQDEGGDSGDGQAWSASWATALTGAEPPAVGGSARNGFNNQTLRMITHLSVGGDKVRIRLSNVFGEATTTISHATVAKPNTSTPELSDIDASTLHQLTFNGSPSTNMLIGDDAVSDPVDMAVGNLQDLVVSVYFATPSGPASWHATSRQSSFQGTGDLADATAGTGFTVRRDCCWYFLSGVDVLRDKAQGSVVVLADSIGDGNGSTLNANKRWPDLLAQRLVQTQYNGKVPAVLNASLAGNRLNHEGPEPATSGHGLFPGFVQLGQNAGARLNEDVYTQTGAQTVIMDLGINDIWMVGDTADALISRIRQINARVQERGLKLVVATLGPYEGFALDRSSPDNEWSPAKEATRNAVNTYLRNSREFSGLIDFDLVLRDPAQPSKLRAEFDSGDHIHPNDAGDQAMVNIIPLRLLGL